MERPLVMVVIMAIVVAFVHAFLALGVPGMSDDSAYLHLRQVESIRATGLPLADDPLAPAGKRLLVTPFYDYVLVAVSFVTGVAVALKVVPAVLVGVVVLLVFLLAFRLTRHGWASLYAALAAAAMPMLLSTSLNTASAAPLVLVLMLALMMQLVAARPSMAWFVLIVMLLSLTHPSVVIVLFGLLFFGALMLISEMRLEPGSGEILLFSTLFIVWSLAVRFKDVLVEFGPSVVFQNVPAAIAAQYFGRPSMLDAALLVGVVPALFGAQVVYTYLFRERRRDVYLLLGFALATGLLLWLSIVDWRIGLTLLGVVLSVLFGVWVKRAAEFLSTTKAAAWRVPLGVMLVLGIALTSVWPAIGAARGTLAEAPSRAELDALGGFALPPGSIVLAMPEEGFRIEALARVKVVQDLDFVTQHDAAQRYEDVRKALVSRSKVDGVALLNKYRATHIYLSERTLAAQGVPPYTDDYSCFPRRFEGSVQLLESACRVARQ